SEAQQLYPTARILMISQEDTTRERRRLFAARVALGNYDFVVMTHGALQSIPMRIETEREYLEWRISLFRQALIDLHESSEDSEKKLRIKRLEKLIEDMRQDMNHK